MKYAEIKHLQEQELRKRLSQAKHSLFSARMKHKMQRLSNTMELRNFKKDIAQLETVLASLPKKVYAKPAQKTKALPAKKVSSKTVATSPDKKSPIEPAGSLSESKKQAQEKTPEYAGPPKSIKPSEVKKGLKLKKQKVGQPKEEKALDTKPQSQPKKRFSLLGLFKKK